MCQSVGYLLTTLLLSCPYLQSVVEHRVLSCLNAGSQDQLMALHGIGVKRAALILDQRSEQPFGKVLHGTCSHSMTSVSLSYNPPQLADLHRVGLSSRAIKQLAQRAALQDMHFNA